MKERRVVSRREWEHQIHHEARHDLSNYSIAAIVPCHNEEASVASVVTDLLESVPGIEVYVYDNRSTDRTAEVARRAGAHVRTENLKGKGNVVRRAFADVEADIYLLIDGDDTYDARMSPALINALIDGPYDHVLGVRNTVGKVDVYRKNHEFGNAALNSIVEWVFGDNVKDMLSGFRVFSRRFVKSFPALSREFEIETELTVHCLALRIPTTSVEVGFRDRPEGSESKLRTYRDGSRILGLILNLARHERPIQFYGSVALIAMLTALVAMIPVLIDYAHTGLVPRVPTVLIAVGLTLVSFTCLISGVMLDGIRRGRHEASRLIYLGLPSVVTTADRVVEKLTSQAKAAESGRAPTERRVAG